jgi:hypothetical protein
MAATAAILDLVSVDYALVDWSNLSVAHWVWLEECSFRWSAPPLIQDGCYGRHLGFGFRRLDDKRVSRLFRSFCGLLGVTRGWVLSMISSAAPPRWPLHGRHFWFGFRRLSDERLRRLVRFFCGSLGAINLYHVSLLPKPYRPYTHRQLPTLGHMSRLALPLLCW